MSLYNVLRTGVSGMNAQSTKLASVSDNIANANTVGYKRADTQFSSLVLDGPKSGYTSGAVTPNVRHEISKQGSLTYTLSKTDIAVEGNGFFVVQDPHNGANYLTRAGSFVLDGASGNLVNAGGYSLLGYPSTAGEDIVITLNDTAGLQTINLDYMNMRSNPSTSGDYRVNVDAGVEAIDINGDPVGPPVVTPDVPASGNDVDGEFHFKNSIVAFDDIGAEVTLDVYWTKIQDAAAPSTQAKWEVVVFDQSTADPAVATSFPYTMPDVPLNGATTADQAYLSRAVLTFDTATGRVDEIETFELYYDGTMPTTVDAFGNTVNDPASTVSPVDPIDPSASPVLAIALPNATDPLQLDLSGTTQLAADFEPLEIEVNGNAPATVKDVQIDNEGRVYAIYEDGAEVEFYRLPMANVASPDQLSQIAGNVYAANPSSGGLRIGLPEDGSNGSLIVGALEQSNVDLATELTDMIMAQRAFSANSKSFQAGNELLEVLVNLKR